MAVNIDGEKFDIDCVSCIRAVSESIAWAHGDVHHARDVMEAKFAAAHVGIAEDHTLAQYIGILHFARYLLCILGDRKTIR